MRLGIIAALVLWCCFGFADEPTADSLQKDEPVLKQIEAATERYFESITKIEEEFCSQIDSIIERSAEQGELDRIIELQNQKKKFLETGYPPTSSVFRSIVRRTKVEVENATRIFSKSYSDAVDQLTEKQDFESAEKIRNDWIDMSMSIDPNRGDGFMAIRRARMRTSELTDDSLWVELKQQNTPFEKTYKLRIKGQAWQVLVHDSVVIGGHSGTDWEVVGGCHVDDLLVFSLKKNALEAPLFFNSCFCEIDNGEALPKFRITQIRERFPEVDLLTPKLVQTVEMARVNYDSLKPNMSKSVFNNLQCVEFPFSDSGSLKQRMLLVENGLVVGGYFEGTKVGEAINGYFDGKHLSFMVREKIQKNNYAMYFGVIKNNTLTLVKRVNIKKPLEVIDTANESQFKSEVFIRPATENDLMYLCNAKRMAK